MKTKLFLLFFILGVPSFNNISAQKGSHEVSIGAGIGTSNQMVSAFSDFLGIGLLAGSYTIDSKSYKGAYTLNYKYLTSNKMGIGGTISYENIQSSAISNPDKIKLGEFENDYYTLGIEADYRYISKPALVIYSGIGLGGTLINQKYTPETIDESHKKTSKDVVHLNFQVTPIGIKVGKTVGAFAELGFGYKGILNLGLFARF